MPITPELLDELLKDYQKPEDLLGQDGLLQQLTRALEALTRASGSSKSDLGIAPRSPCS
jgi:putative transposase